MNQKFQERRDGILGVFNEAKKNLEQLNVEIQDQFNANSEAINVLLQHNKELSQLASDNKKSISVFSKIFN